MDHQLGRERLSQGERGAGMLGEGIAVEVDKHHHAAAAIRGLWMNQHIR